MLCALAVGLKYKLGYDDSLDVVGVHLVGGLWGTLAIGLFATADAPAGVDGLLYGGGADQLGRQAIGAFAVLLYSGILTFIIGFALHKTIGFRVAEEDELEGVDSSEHAETGYDLGTLSASLRGVSFGGSATRRRDEDDGPGSHAAKTDEEVSA